MRRFILFIVSLVFALSINAQTSQTVTYDFVHPETLSPAIDMGDLFEKQVAGTTFTIGPISFNLESTKLKCSLRKGDEGYFLMIPRGTTITLKGDKVKLKSFSMGDIYQRGGLGLDAGQPGSFRGSKVPAGWCCRNRAQGSIPQQGNKSGPDHNGHHHATDGRH